MVISKQIKKTDYPNKVSITRKIFGAQKGTNGHVTSADKNYITNMTRLAIQSLLDCYFTSSTLDSSLMDKVTHTKDSFHNWRRMRKGFFCLQKETVSAFELLPSTLIKKGLLSTFKCIHFKLESVGFSNLTQLDQN